MHKYTVKKDTVDIRDHVAAPPGIPLPPSVDLSHWLGPVKDQGDLGSCTGFAFCGLREFLWRKFYHYEKANTAFLTDEGIFSPLFLYYQERLLEGDVNEDGGAESRTGLRVLATYGVCREASDPYNPKIFTQPPTAEELTEAQEFRIGAYHRVPDLETLKSVLASGYCASLAIIVYESFEDYVASKTGVIPMPDTTKEQQLGGHEVLCYGYDDVEKVLKVRNSWGPDWGSQGNFFLPYTYWQYVMDSWTAHLGRPWR